ncbi:MAG TPA: BTAD domain-containing putative transcriptional regulator, partial [Pseudonocardiaceae bacterium]|nr:BTAD domain-containing putative transcriptional regulator [Pseudonocardiaceae bacterium]
MRFGVLGPTTVWTDGGDEVPISGVKVRALVTHLALHVGTPVTADRLIEDLWDEPTLRNPAGALSAKVSQLRRALEDAEPGGRTLVVSPPPGYRLDVDPGAVDAVEFERLVAQAQGGSDPRRTVRTLDRALALWRGPVCAEFADAEFTRPTITRLDDLRLTAHETLAAARLDLGEHAAVVDGLAELVAAHPWRERLRLAHALALYRCGRQQEALAGIDEYRRHLADELGLDPGQEVTALRGAILAQDPSITPRRRARPVSNLPVAVTSLVGRDDAVAELVGALPGTRLTTLTGPGGVGKTSLALDVARRSAFGSGAWLVELAAVERAGSRDSPAALADLVLATLGIRQVGDAPEDDPVDRLTGALRDAHTLLVLDNCEQVVGSVAAMVDRLLRGTRDVAVLATSREPLGLTGETVWTVPPLAVPGTRDQRDPDLVGRSPAVRLFVERAKAADRGFDLTGWNAAMVGTLCRRLDGIPLALELAATRVATLGVPELLARLGDRFRLLAGARRDAPARHQTLAAVIEWSWELLTPVEQAVLRRLSAHVDGCALDAAEATCDGPDVPAESVVDVLARLVERSLVVVVHRRGGTRYRLLESVADYAAARCADAGEVDRQRERHRDYYADLASRAAPELTGHDQQTWLARLDDDSANLRAAVESAAVDGAAADALTVVASAMWFW